MTDLSKMSDEELIDQIEENARCEAYGYCSYEYAKLLKYELLRRLALVPKDKDQDND